MVGFGGYNTVFLMEWIRGPCPHDLVGVDVDVEVYHTILGIKAKRC